MKKILIPFLLMLLSAATFGQVGSQSVSGIKYRVNDTTTYQAAAATAHAQGYSDIYWNNQATNKHWDIWNGSSYDHVNSLPWAGGSGAGTSIPFGVTSGTNTMTATMTPTVTSYTDGLTVKLRITNSNTVLGAGGLTTINLDGVGAKKVFLATGLYVSGHELEAGQDIFLTYNTSIEGGAGGWMYMNGENHGRVFIIGSFDASTNIYPATPTVTGSGAGGSVRHGDAFFVDTPGTLATGLQVNTDDIIIAKADNAATESTYIVIPSTRTVQSKISAATVGSHDEYISAAEWWPRNTAGCSFLTPSEMTTSLFNIQTLDFDQSAQEFAQTQLVLPKSWNNGTVTATIYWTAASGTGGVVWGISGGAYSNDDALTVAFGTAVTVSGTLTAANDLQKTSISSPITLSGTPTDADFLALQISRNPADVSDTLTADAKLLAVVLTYTTDANTD